MNQLIGLAVGEGGNTGRPQKSKIVCRASPRSPAVTVFTACYYGYTCKCTTYMYIQRPAFDFRSPKESNCPYTLWWRR